MSAVKKYYSVHELMELLSVSEKTIRRRIKAGAFGDHLVDVGTSARPSIRVPASDVNAYLERNQVHGGVTARTHDLFADLGMKARTPAELKRKLADAHGQSTAN
jgi:hypothetical protein